MPPSGLLAIMAPSVSLNVLGGLIRVAGTRLLHKRTIAYKPSDPMEKRNAMGFRRGEYTADWGALATTLLPGLPLALDAIHA